MFDVGVLSIPFNFVLTKVSLPIIGVLFKETPLVLIPLSNIDFIAIFPILLMELLNRFDPDCESAEFCPIDVPINALAPCIYRSFNP
ncbi:MAG: hypothetical protein ABFD07_16050, partial [Methanobacterium sp.]